MKKILVLALSLGFATVGYAEDNTEKPKKKSANDRVNSRTGEIAEDLHSYHTAAYGMAGCGLGSLIVTENSFLQIFAATSNDTVANQSFGITSGTSNCVARAKHTAEEQRVFIESNYATLSKEAAQGDGRHIDAFAELLGCDHGEFKRFSKDQYEAIFATPEPAKIIATYRVGFGGRCSRLGAT